MFENNTLDELRKKRRDNLLDKEDHIVLTSAKTSSAKPETIEKVREIRRDKQLGQNNSVSESSEKTSFAKSETIEKVKKLREEKAKGQASQPVTSVASIKNEKTSLAEYYDRLYAPDIPAKKNQAPYKDTEGKYISPFKETMAKTLAPSQMDINLLEDKIKKGGRVVDDYVGDVVALKDIINAAEREPEGRDEEVISALYRQLDDIQFKQNADFDYYTKIYGERLAEDMKGLSDEELDKLIEKHGSTDPISYNLSNIGEKHVTDIKSQAIKSEKYQREVINNFNALSQEDREAVESVTDIEREIQKLEHQRSNVLQYKNAIGRSVSLPVGFAEAKEEVIAEIDRQIKALKAKKESVKSRLYAYGYSSELADDILSYGVILYNDKQNQKLKEDVKGLSTSGLVGANVASIPANLTSGLGQLDITFQTWRNRYSKNYRPVDYNTPASAGGRYAREVRGETNERIDSDGWRFVYNTTMSIADTATATLVAGHVAPVLLSGSAGLNAIYDAKERGASDIQAVNFGIASAVSEALFEAISIGSFLKPKDIPGLKAGIVNTLKQMFTEGTEEVATSIFNDIADKIIMGDKSQFETNVREYMSAGLTREQAEQAAMEDYIRSLGIDFLGGFVSGFFFGGVDSYSRHVVSKEKQAGEKRIKQIEDYETAFMSDGEKALYHAAEEKMRKNDGMTYSEARISLIEDKLRESGATGDKHSIRAKAEAINNALSGNITRRGINPIVGDKSALDVFNELAGENIIFNGTAATKDSILAFANNRRTMQSLRSNSALGRASTLGQNGILAYNVLNVPEVYAEEFVRYYDAGLSGMSIRSADKVTGSVMPEYMKSLAHEAGRLDARAYANKNAPDSSGTADKKFDLKHTTDNRRVVVIKDNILDGVAQKDYVKTVKDAISKFKPAIPVSGRLIKVNKTTGEEYTNSRYSNHLRYTDSVKYIDKLTAAGHLDEIVLASENYVNEDLKHKRKDNIKEFARGSVLLDIGGNKYNASVIVAFTANKEMLLYDVIDMANTNFDIKYDLKNKTGSLKTDKQTQQTASPSIRGELPANKSISQKGTNVKKAQGKAMLKSTSVGFTEGERAAPIDAEGQAFLDKLGKALGIQITYDNADSSDYNGYYINGKMVIARSATKPYLTVVAHETTHRFVESDPKGARAYGNYVIQKMYKGKTLDAEIQRIIDAHEAEGIQMDRAGAMEEICANYTELMLNDVSLFEKLAQENYNLAKKLLDFLKDVLSSIKAAFHGKNAQVDRYGLTHAEMERAARLWQRALRRSEKNVSKSADSSVESDDNVTENTNASDDSEAANAKHMLKENIVPYTEREKQNWKNSNSIIVYENSRQFEAFVEKVLMNEDTHKKIYFGKISNSIAELVFEKTGIDISGHNIALKGYEIRKILLNSHGDEIKEAARGQETITVDDLKNIPSVITSPDNVSLSDKEYEGKPTLLFEKNIDGKNYVVAYVSRKHHDIAIQTMYKKRSLATAKNANALFFTSKTTSSTASNDSIAQNAPGVNTAQATPEGKASLKILGEEFADVSIFESGKLAEVAKEVSVRNAGAVISDSLIRDVSSKTGVSIRDLKTLRTWLEDYRKDLSNQDALNKFVDGCLQASRAAVGREFKLKKGTYTYELDIYITSIANDLIKLVSGEKYIPSQNSRFMPAEKHVMRKLISENARLKERVMGSIKKHRTHSRIDLMRDNDRLTEENAALIKIVDRNTKQKLLNVAKRLLNGKKIPEDIKDKARDEFKKLGITEVDLNRVYVKKGEKASLSVLKTVYKNLQELNPEYVDERIDGYIDDLEKQHVDELSPVDARKLLDVLRAIEHEYKYSNKLIGELEHKKLSQIALEELQIIENGLFIDATSFHGMVGNKYAGLVYTPENLMLRATGADENSALYRLFLALKEGQRGMQQYILDADDMFSEFAKDRKFIEGLNSAKHKVEIGKDEKGNSVYITHDQLIALVLNARCKGNADRIRQRGIYVQTLKSYLQGKNDWQGAATLKLTKNEIEELGEEHLTAKEKKYLETQEKYFKEMNAEAVNKASMKLRGYMIALMKNYYPMYSNPDFVSRDYSYIVDTGMPTHEYGNLKERKEDAGAPLLLLGSTYVLERNIKSAARYSNLAVPMSNFKKLYNAKVVHYDFENINKMAAKIGLGKIKNGKQKKLMRDKLKRENVISKGSVKEHITNQLGSSANEQIQQFLRDTAGAADNRDQFGIANRIKRGYARTQIALNISSFFVQLTGLMSASPIVGYKNAVAAYFHKFAANKHEAAKRIELINKYTPLLRWRARGYTSQQLGDITVEIGRNVASKTIDRVLSSRTLDWMTAVDVWTAQKIWQAAEYKILSENKELREQNADKFYKLVAEVFNDAIEKTQPNNTPLQRPRIMRDKSGKFDLFTLFKSQAYSSLNTLYEQGIRLACEIERARIAGNTESSKARKVKAWKGLGSAVASLVTVSVMAELARFVANAIRHTWEDYEDEEGKLAFGAAFKEARIGFIVGLTEPFPIINLVASTVESFVKHGLNSVSDTVTDSYAGVINDVIALIFKFGNKLYNSVVNGESFDYDVAWDITKAIGTVPGLPINNAAKDLAAIPKWITEFKYGFNSRLSDFMILGGKKDLYETKNGKKQLTSKAVEVAAWAYINDYDGDYKAIVQEINNSTVSDKSREIERIENKAEKLLKEKEEKGK